LYNYSILYVRLGLLITKVVLCACSVAACCESVTQCIKYLDDIEIGLSSIQKFSFRCADHLTKVFIKPRCASAQSAAFTKGVYFGASVCQIKTFSFLQLVNVTKLPNCITPDDY